jgi:hypothetical protein
LGSVLGEESANCCSILYMKNMGELSSKMFETFKEEKFVPKFERAIDLVKPEYRVLLQNLKAYQLLFKFKYQEHVSSLSQLCDLVGCQDVEHVIELERNLDAYLCRMMGGVVRSDLLEMVCPECFQLALTNYSKDGEEIKKACGECGFEADESVSDIEDFDTSLDREVTFAPTSHASWTRGLGNTFDAKKDLKKLICDYATVEFSELKESNPQIAAQFDSSNGFLVALDSMAKALLPMTELVVFGDNVYRKMSGSVRRMSLLEFYSIIDCAFHANDVYLRRQKGILASSDTSDLKNALTYGLDLCKRYGFDRKDRDQALFNTVGHEIRLMKHQLKVQRRHVPEKRLVETVFYICLLRFDKTGVAVKAKSELDIDMGLVNYYEDYKAFLRTHDKVNSSSVLLNVFEQASSARKNSG